MGSGTMSLDRRAFLLGSAAMVSAMGIPIAAHAGPDPEGLKFLFVFSAGGWDPTRVFAAEFDNPNIDLEVDAQRGQVGGISFVDHVSRPSVRDLFEAHHERTLVLNGLMVRSIAHEICTMIAMTGSSGGSSPDWPAILGDAQRQDYILPHLVIGGPSFPGDRVASVARTGTTGQLEGLLDGSALTTSDLPTPGMSRPAESLIDRYLLRRSRARTDASRSALEAALTRDYERALEKAVALKDLRYVMDFSQGADLPSQAAVAVEALATGVSRCVTISSSTGLGSWDTHTNNDVLQSPLWEDLFAGLLQLMQLLENTPGEREERLADETVVVVLSEMGRTPQLNTLDGKDHWPFTSAMLIGPGLTGSRVVGGFDELYYGRLVDPSSGELTPSGSILSAETLGATLLALAGIDPAQHIGGVEPLWGVLT